MTCKACLEASRLGEWWSAPPLGGGQVIMDVYGFSSEPSESIDFVTVNRVGQVDGRAEWLCRLRSPLTTEGLCVAWNAYEDAFTPTTGWNLDGFMTVAAASYPHLRHLWFATRNPCAPPVWLSSLTRLESLMLHLDVEGAVLRDLDLQSLKALDVLAIRRPTRFNSFNPVYLDAATVHLPPSIKFLLLEGVEVLHANQLMLQLPVLEVMHLCSGTLFLDSDDDQQMCYNMTPPTTLKEVCMHEVTYGSTLIECLFGGPGVAASMTNLEALSTNVAEVPACIGQLKALEELSLLIHLHPNDILPPPRDTLHPLASLTSLRELTFTTETNHPQLVLPYMPSVTRLELLDDHPMHNVAESMPNLKHLRVAFSDLTDSYAPLATVTSLTSLTFDAPEDRGDGQHGVVTSLPPHLDKVRSLRHLCVHAVVEGTPTMRRALGGCSIETVCTGTVFDPQLTRPTFRCVECPIQPTRFHVEYM